MKFNANQSVDSPESPAPTGIVRKLLPQIIACMILNILMFSIGLAIGFPTIAIPAMRGQQPDKYPGEDVLLTAEQSSWFGSLLFLTEPLGSVFSGWITEQIGRKRALFLSTVPLIVAWAGLYFAQSTAVVFLAGILYGFATGLQGAPIYTFAGEICTPQIRGVLLTLTSMSTMLGIFAIFILGSVTTWRNASLVGFFVPIAGLIALTIVPETPQWLIGQNRIKEATKSLQWLRGWTTESEVAQEMAELTSYIEQANACASCQRDTTPTNGKCTHSSSYREKVKDLLRTKSLRPFTLVCFCMIVIQSSGNASIRPFLVQIFETFRIPIDPNWGSVIMGLVDILANLFCVIVIPIIGKRRMMLLGLTGVVVFCYAVSINAYYYLTFDTSSFDIQPIQDGQAPENNYAFALFICLGVSASVSGCVPWMMNSEVYPFRIRGTASGLTSAFAYFTIFLATKLYIDFEYALSIFGSFILYGTITLFGLCVLYMILPETEGRSLEEIEAFFSDKSRKLTDRKIRKIVPVSAAEAAPEPVSSLDNLGYEKSPS